MGVPKSIIVTENLCDINDQKSGNGWGSTTYRPGPWKRGDKVWQCRENRDPMYHGWPGDVVVPALCEREMTTTHPPLVRPKQLYPWRSRNMYSITTRPTTCTPGSTDLPAPLIIAKLSACLLSVTCPQPGWPPLWRMLRSATIPSHMYGSRSLSCSCWLLGLCSVKGWPIPYPIKVETICMGLGGIYCINGYRYSRAGPLWITGFYGMSYFKKIQYLVINFFRGHLLNRHNYAKGRLLL